MINNRQQSGRRRGRGGQRQQGGGRGIESGNRIDNRARGNAAQLLEKYKTLARDAQQSGDRVLTEYYHQFADHYFRVLSESRARFDEQSAQKRPQGDYAGGDDGYDEGEDGGEDGDGFDARPQQPQRPPQQRYDRDDRPQRYERDDRPPSYQREASDEGERAPRADQEDRRPRDGYNGERPQRDRDEFAPREARPPRAPRPERPPEATTLSPDFLPPAFGLEGEPATQDDAPAPRRRGRPRKDASPPPAA